MRTSVLILVFVASVWCDGLHGHAERRGRDKLEDAPLDSYGLDAVDASLDGYEPEGAASDVVADPLAMLQANIPGIPGEDYPILAEVPESAFTCDGQVEGGYYADPEAECQVFHICTNDGNGGLSKYSFLCPNGTIFNQNYFICDWWFNFDCAEAEGLFSLNDDIAAERAEIDAAAADADAAASDALDVYAVTEAASEEYGAPEAASDLYGSPEDAPEYEARARTGRRSGLSGGRRQNGQRRNFY